jgi:hypothetical protein
MRGKEASEKEYRNKWKPPERAIEGRGSLLKVL